jgi:hypothetical protein
MVELGAIDFPHRSSERLSLLTISILTVLLGFLDVKFHELLVFLYVQS